MGGVAWTAVRRDEDRGQPGVPVNPSLVLPLLVIRLDLRVVVLAHQQEATANSHNLFSSPLLVQSRGRQRPSPGTHRSPPALPERNEPQNVALTHTDSLPTTRMDYAQ